MQVGGLGRLGELRAVAALGDLHVVVPELRREGRAGDLDAVDVGHRDRAVGVADPDDRRQPRRVAGEPGVLEVVGRPGLAGGRAAHLRRLPGSVLHVLLEDLRDLVGLAVLEQRVLARRVQADRRPAIAEVDATDGRDLDAVAGRWRRSSRPARARAARHPGAARRAPRPDIRPAECRCRGWPRCRRPRPGRRRGPAAGRPSCRTPASPSPG